MRLILMFAATMLASQLAVALHGADSIPCVHVKHEGKAYSLAYAGTLCPHPNSLPLPPSLYKPLASWAFNASHAKIISEWERLRILARLATLVETETHGFALGPCSFGPWSDNEWAHHADQAYLGLTDALKRSPPPEILKVFERDALRLRFASKSEFFRIEFRESKKLSTKERQSLAKLFADLENGLRERQELRIVERSLEQAVHEMRDPAIQAKRRENFEAFRIEE